VAIFAAGAMTLINFTERYITTYFLGPNLNVMPTVLSPRQPFSLGVPPLAEVDGTHTLFVALVYALIFIVVAIVLAWKRDVKE